MGSALNKCTFCSLCCLEKEVHIFDENKALVHVLNARCCQMAHICPGFPCNACQTFEFKKKDKEDFDGSIVRKSKGCLMAMCCPGIDADNYIITFDKEPDSKKRALLLSTNFFVDFQFFEKFGGKV